MAHDEHTSRRIARIAARGLRHPASLTLEEVQEVCGSALDQARDHYEKHMAHRIRFRLGGQPDPQRVLDYARRTLELYELAIRRKA
jgi:hypothetical protein